MIGELGSGARIDARGIGVVQGWVAAGEARAIADSDPYHKGGFRSYRLQRWVMNEGTLGLRLNFSDGSYSID